ncbi:NAD(P)/FAD-dependent oxidoreductase [Horticoccus sp. 23ND18S-11]|uniref:NAD(P)/FAD-dependent oxidoreductase n=1 Tax=Horticoccus sp. 23ND18S-11 TaxID=3391832 RepID=UPI0039C965DD
MRPIEIIGGGLAGLSLGLALRRDDVPVTLHEAGDYPRHRVCGEFIAGLEATTMARLGITGCLQDALHHDEVAWSRSGGRPVIQRLPVPALGLSRHVLDARLAEAFTAAGGGLHIRSRINHPETRPGRVLATGRAAGPPRWIGLKLHAAALDLTRDLEMHLGAHGYVGLARIAEGVNICGLFRVRALQGRGAGLLLAYLRAAGLGTLADRVAAASIDPASVCAVAGLSFKRQPLVPGSVCLGDASAMIPPFTGNGMAMAFQSAEVALDPLRAYARGEMEWSDTCRAIHRAVHDRFRLRLTSARALHSFVLSPWRQRWFTALSRARVLPFRSIYAALH